MSAMAGKAERGGQEQCVMMSVGASCTQSPMVRMRPFTGANLQRRPFWKVTLQSAGMFDYCLSGEWNVGTRVHRWRWLARLVARWHMFAPTEGLVRRATVEPYWPGENVIRFPSPGERREKREGANARAGVRNGQERSLPGKSL
jgi:hypothetical protein